MDKNIKVEHLNNIIQIHIDNDVFLIKNLNENIKIFYEIQLFLQIVSFAEYINWDFENDSYYFGLYNNRFIISGPQDPSFYKPYETYGLYIMNKKSGKELVEQLILIMNSIDNTKIDIIDNINSINNLKINKCITNIKMDKNIKTKYINNNIVQVFIDDDIFLVLIENLNETKKIFQEILECLQIISFTSFIKWNFENNYYITLSKDKFTFGGFQNVNSVIISKYYEMSKKSATELLKQLIQIIDMINNINFMNNLKIND